MDLIFRHEKENPYFVEMGSLFWLSEVSFSPPGGGGGGGGGNNDAL